MSFLLKEDGDKILQENGDGILLELHKIVSAIKNISILTTKNKKSSLLTNIKKSIMKSNNSNRTRL